MEKPVISENQKILKRIDEMQIKNDGVEDPQSIKEEEKLKFLESIKEEITTFL